MRTKFIVAMVVYAVLALIATFWIDGTLRIAIWILLGALALKTLIARAAGW
jgi:hypothetical protein